MDHIDDLRATNFYEYLEHQRSNPIDLSAESIDSSNQCRIIAEHVFKNHPDNLKDNLTRLQIDESMGTVDVFSMLTEILLYGINILTGGNQSIFDLETDLDDFIYLLKKYIRSIGFDIEVNNELVNKDDVNMYRDRDDYYCVVTKKPPPDVCNYGGWTLLNYRLLENRKFIFDKESLLEDFTGYFINKNKEIFTFYFEFVTANTL